MCAIRMDTWWSSSRGPATHEVATDRSRGLGRSSPCVADERLGEVDVDRLETLDVEAAVAGGVRAEVNVGIASSRATIAKLSTQIGGASGAAIRVEELGGLAPERRVLALARRPWSRPTDACRSCGPA